MANILKKLEKACQNSRERGNSKELAQNLEDLACLHTDNRDWSQVIETREELLGVLERSSTKIELARCHRFIGEAFLELRIVDSALKHVRSYLKLCQDENESEKQRAFTTLGRVFVAKYDIDGTEGALEKAVQYYNSALLLAMKFEKNKSLGLDEARLMRGRLLYNLALVAQRSHKPEDVVKHLERAVYTLKQLISTKLEKDSKLDLFNALCELCETKAKLQDAPASERAAKDALDIARKNKNTSQRGEAYILLGLAKLAAKEWKDARRAYNHARVYAKAFDENRRQELLEGLKNAVRLEKWADALKTAGTSDANVLNERVGDTLVKYGLLRDAISFYKKVRPPPGRCKRYAAVCGSIAETHCDLWQFSEAKDWYLKELEYRERDDFEELCSLYLSLLNCARRMEDRQSIEKLIGLAIENCKKCDKRYVRKNALKTIQDVCEHFGMPQEGYLGAIGDQEDSAEETGTEDDSEEQNDSQESDVSVNLSDLSIEIASDVEERVTKNRVASKRVAEKKNERGETLLQQECIKGNMQMIERLIAQGFDVNSSDNGGFTCLHDAANHGFLEVVRALVEAGASVNVESKDTSHRITPLHSASADGHYLIASYLLDKGANPKALTIRGQTAFDILDPSDTQDEVYLSVRAKLERADLEVCHLKAMVRRRYQHIKTPSPFLTVNDQTGGHAEQDAVVIEHDLARPRRKKQSSLNDVVVRNKRTRDYSSEEEMAVISQTSRSSCKRKKQPKINSVLRDLEESSNDTVVNAFDRTLICSTPTKDMERIDEEFKSFDDRSVDKDVSLDQRTSIEVSNSTSSSLASCNFSGAPVNIVRVRVDDRLLSIPLPKDFQSLTIAYLEQQASERYAELEGTKPVINIALEDGAILSASDPIQCVQGIPILKGVVVSWTIPPLEERYSNRSEKPIGKILAACKAATVSGKFLVSHMKIPQSLFIVLKHEVHLQTLSLRFIHMDTSAMLALTEALGRLRSLKELVLVGSNLRGKEILELFSNFQSDLDSLDLSFTAGDVFFVTAIKNFLSSRKALKTLRVSSCGLTEGLLKGLGSLCSLRCLDVSFNPLGGVDAIARLLAGSEIMELDLSNCFQEFPESGLRALLSPGLGLLKVNGNPTPAGFSEELQEMDESLGSRRLIIEARDCLDTGLLSMELANISLNCD